MISTTRIEHGGAGFALCNRTGLMIVSLVTLAAVAAASAEPLSPTYEIPGKPAVATLYVDGSQQTVQTLDRWKFICGSDGDLSQAELESVAAAHIEAIEEGPLTIIDSPSDSRGFDIVFITDSSVPAAAEFGLLLAETFLEDTFSDPITIEITVTFEQMSPNVIGATWSSYVENISYTTSRLSLVAGQDEDDFIQDWLPTTGYLPVRFDGASDSVNNVQGINWTRAAYRSTIGSVSGYAAGMSFNTDFLFDYDPSNGVSGTRMSFVDVMIHECGHALGFTSATDWGSHPTALDLYRFQRTDGNYNYNPETYEEFRDTPRLVSHNSPNDQHISDLIDNEYRMSDGDPWQASHFREQSNPWIGLLDPAFSTGETHYPTYFSQADLNMFDAIGYDYPPCVYAEFSEHPEPETVVCPGATVELSVTVDIANPSYQWRRAGNALEDDGMHIFGATTPTLTIVDIGYTHVSSGYNCLVTNLNGGCSEPSRNAVVEVTEAAWIVQQPPDTSTPRGEQTQIHCTADGEPTLGYQWRKNGEELYNGQDGIYGVTSPNLLILYTQTYHAGVYDVVITNVCGSVTSELATLTVTLGAGLGDLNCDGAIDFDDIDPFVTALGGEGPYQSAYPACLWLNADCNDDGAVDFDDIDAFVALLAGD